MVTPFQVTPVPRDVERIVEVVGARGGKTLVPLMSCGHWMTSRTPKRRAMCIGCAIAALDELQPKAEPDAAVGPVTDPRDLQRLARAVRVRRVQAKKINHLRTIAG
jgi:hypothetical protein